VGKHQTIATLGGRIALAVPSIRQRPRDERWTLPISAFLIAFAIVLVMVVDPYSGDYADAATAPNHWGDRGTQQFEASGAYTITLNSHGGYSVRVATPASKGTIVAAAGIPSPGSAQAIALAILTSQGMGNDQYSCLVSLWNRESHWSVTAANPSGAYGIPQAKPGNKMASAGPDWKTNARTQILWGLSYISARYSTPCGAWAHSQSTGWY
jgi:hypothetical protein